MPDYFLHKSNFGTGSYQIRKKDPKTKAGHRIVVSGLTEAEARRILKKKAAH